MKCEEDESWEEIWPPECTNDRVLVQKCMGMIRDSSDLTLSAWEYLVNESRFLADLYRRSGTMVKPFIDQAITSCGFDAGHLDVDLVESILLHAQEDPDPADEVYRGCVWELTATLAACIIHVKTGRNPPGSCYEPIDRAHFILANS
jgi:hypothetical protein